MPSLTVIVPATDVPETLERCRRAIAVAESPPEQVVVVDGPAGASPAAARNLGAAQARGEILVFVDADVEVHRDVFRRIREAFDADSGLSALFGSYDDDPGAPGVVSSFRNLLHHHVHQTSGGPAATFWAGLGAIRRTAFQGAGGFVEHPVEDIELGMRLADEGARILLDPTIQGKHLKAWSVWGMVRTDFVVRGVPWVGLLLRHRSSATHLNLGWRHRLSALASVALVVSAAARRPFLAGGALVALVALNVPFYALLVRRRGLVMAIAGAGLHVLHHLTGLAAVPVGVLAYVRQRRSAKLRERRVG